MSFCIGMEAPLDFWKQLPCHMFLEEFSPPEQLADSQGREVRVAP